MSTNSDFCDKANLRVVNVTNLTDSESSKLKIEVFENYDNDDCWYDVTFDAREVTQSILQKLIKNIDGERVQKFTGCDLSGIKFPDSLDLASASFTNANLKRAHFSGANLDFADFSNADISDCNFADCSIKNVIFSRAKNPELAVFEDEQIMNAKITITSAKNLTQNERDFLKIEKVNGGYDAYYNVNFDGKSIEKSLLKKLIAKLSYTSCNYFFNCDLSGITFPENSDLDYCKFKGANCKDVNFNGSSLKSVQFQDANCEGANFDGCNLSGADFANAKIRNATFINAYNLDDVYNLDLDETSDTETTSKTTEANSMSRPTFSTEEITNHSLALPAINEVAYRGFKKLLRF